MKLAPGTVIDRYRVEEELGRGGMAVVYRVRHSTLDTLHALKVLTLSGQEIRDRLVREGKVQAQLTHPNIVPVRDILDLEQGPGLLMDYIDGSSLDAWLRSYDPDPAERERIFAAIVSGVGFAHDRGVVHRDLKPGNVMMQRQHDQWVPRVADFGLAKVLSAEEAEGPLQSRTGRPMGTPAYMAPEQVRSAKHVDARADVFALGCILYELVCGQRAFVGNDSLEVFNRITQGVYRPPRQAVQGLEPRVEQAIFGALAVHPDDRIPDCATLLAVLRGERAWVVAPEPAATFMGSDFGMDAPAGSVGAGAGGGMATVAPQTYEGTPPGLPGPDSSLGPRSAPSHGSLAPVEGSIAPSLDAGRTGLSVAWVVAAGMGLAVLLIGAFLLGRGPAPEVTAVPTAGGALDEPVPAQDEPVPALEGPAPGTPAQPVREPAPAVRPVVAPVAAPVPQAPPVPPAPKPSPRPVPAPTSPELPSHIGRVEVTGDARMVRFRGSGGTIVEAGEVAPGSYVIEAAFDAGPPMHAGNLEVKGGQTVHLRCNSATLMCSP